MNKVYILPDDKFRIMVETSSSYSDVLRGLGLSPKGGNSSRLLKRRISELSCCLDHFTDEATRSRKYSRYRLEDILVEDSTYTSMNRLKNRLKNELDYPQVCSCCGIGTLWNGLSLILQLDHVNGVHNDHRLGNLRLLCPNCHSQTDTFAGRNKVK